MFAKNPPKGCTSFSSLFFFFSSLSSLRSFFLFFLYGAVLKYLVYVGAGIKDPLDFINEVRDSDDSFLGDFSIKETPEKLVVCVNESSVSTAQAWGGRYRIQPPENAAEWNRQNNFEKYQRILVHELVHVITYSIPSQKESLLIPIWFMEGMAEYLTGGQIASSVDRNFVLDRNEILFSEYAEAARVVRYIVDTLGNGDRSIYDLMLTMRSYATGEEQYFSSSYLDSITFNSFPQSFRETFVDFDGSELTLDELHDEFIQRLN